ncbi:MAG TPA: nitrilase-related carbon-nitrogen hydrolase [Methanotrichaceae archaeon]|nr:nitrilase-related carbon-nitrogen hydrolase [Methanotrichaceae archaeon]
MHAACLQLQVCTCDIAGNMHRSLEMAVGAIDQGAEILAFPELFLTGFCYQDFAQDRTPYRSLDPFRTLAREHGCIILGSIISGRHNLGFCLGPESEGFYAKAHPFGDEKAHFDGGDSIRPIPSSQGSVGLEICYDLRFPEVARSLTLQGADFLVTVAQFPAKRKSHWRTLAIARAMENQIPHIACNCAGPECCGTSMIIDAWGEVLAEAGPGEEIVLGEIDLDKRDRIRQEINCLADRRTDLY